MRYRVLLVAWETKRWGKAHLEGSVRECAALRIVREGDDTRNMVGEASAK